LPKFTRRTGIEVRVVAVGTGQALKNARNGDADVVFVHSREDEERFVSEGWGVERHDVMYNDFVIVGPTSDPAGIRGLSDAEQAFEKIAMVEAPFASRGDNSGTHKAELKLWKNSEIDPLRSSGDWYLETGSGMGATLNTAVGKRAYALADRGTWLGFANKNGFEVLVEGDRQLLNQYGVILVSPERHPNVKAKMGAAFVDWLTSTEGQKAIASFKIDGQQLFFPNARPRA
jgi:tungstate transport system substrate-binding protein